jgi:hypothetical protein
MVSNDFFNVLKDLAEEDDYKKLTAFSDSAVQAQRPLESLMRFFVLTYYDYDGKLDVEEFIDESIITLAEKDPPKAELDGLVKDTFGLLHAALGDDALRKYDADTDKFGGRVGQVSLEVIAVGVARNLRKIKRLSNKTKFVAERVKEFWQRDEAASFSSSGLRGTQRLKQTIPFGAEWFAP